MIRILNIFPEESAYSYFSRLYAHSGYVKRTTFAREVFHSESPSTEFEFVFPLNQEFRVELEKHITMEELVLHHSLFPYYARFLDKDRKTKAYNYALLNQTYIHSFLPIACRQTEDYLRFCPKCVEEDRLKYGECFFHIQHIIPNVHICPHHGCELINTDIRNFNGYNCRLFPLESIVEGYCRTTKTFSDDDINFKVTKYITDVFSQPLNFQLEMRIGDYMNNRLDAKYFSSRGDVRKVDLLFDDFSTFYNGLVGYDKKRWRVSYIYKNQSVNPYDISLSALFQGISPQDLCSCGGLLPSLTDAFDTKVRELRKQKKTVEEICSLLKVCKDVVVKILAGYYDGTNVGFARFYARKRDNWEELDEELCERFDEFLATSPTEITLRTVGEYFQQDRTLVKLPKLRKHIANYQRTHYYSGVNVGKQRKTTSK